MIANTKIPKMIQKIAIPVKTVNSSPPADNSDRIPATLFPSPVAPMEIIIAEVGGLRFR